MHSPHLLAQMSHFLMSLREQHQKLRLVQEANSKIRHDSENGRDHNLDVKNESSSASTTSRTKNGQQENHSWYRCIRQNRP